MQRVWYWQSLRSRWGAWSWDIICALWGRGHEIFVPFGGVVMRLFVPFGGVVMRLFVPFGGVVMRYLCPLGCKFWWGGGKGKGEAILPTLTSCDVYPHYCVAINISVHTSLLPWQWLKHSVGKNLPSTSWHQRPFLCIFGEVLLNILTLECPLLYMPWCEFLTVSDC